MADSIFRDENGNPFIVLKKYVEPDFTISRRVKTYSDNYDHHLLHFCLEENIMIVEDTDEEFQPKSWDNPRFMSIKIEDNRVWYLHQVRGWLPHEDATNKYAEILAEKELLDE